MGDDDLRMISGRATSARGTENRGLSSHTHPFDLFRGALPGQWPIIKPFYDPATGQIDLNPGNFPPPAYPNRDDIEI